MIYIYTNVDIHKCRYTQMKIYTNLVYKQVNVHICRLYTKVDIHKCRYTQMQIYTNVDKHK